MTPWIFSQQDQRQIEALGINPSQVEAQLAIFRKGHSYLLLNRPCTLGDGILQIPPEEKKTFVEIQEKAAQEGRFIKFVPASGVASRMFQALLSCYHTFPTRGMEELFQEADPFHNDLKACSSFLNNLDRFAFFEELKKCLDREGLEREVWTEPGNCPAILGCLLTEKGLNYANLPKGLIQFHRYPNQNRTSFEEHLMEASRIVCDSRRINRLHFTVSIGHQEGFIGFFEKVRPLYEQITQSQFEVTFSSQSHTTDTISVDLDNQPFHQHDGSLLFRPGGHGALLTNLNDLQGDLIYIKNIDNIQPDHLKGDTILWKKVLGGFLIQVQEKVHHYLKALHRKETDPVLIEEAWAFCRDQLSISEPPGSGPRSLLSRKAFILEKLNRPIRVCGMVKNEGEPGGGPFWVQGKDGTLSLQIVEKAQVDPKASEQQGLWARATHFNPVDLVCAVRDYRGCPFDLHRYTDPGAIFLSRKSYQGQALKALELPGLWNGSMADWITVFIEVPISTFTPVKTVMDLLRPAHQPGGE